MTYLPDEPVAPVGVVVERGRGSLPFALLHGEPLVACAAWALGAAGVWLLDLGTPWEDVVAAQAPLVLHDPLCPMVPPEFLLTCVRRAEDAGVVVAGVLPVTDTIKVLLGDPEGELVGETLDRDRLAHLVSPIVLPVPVVGALDDWPPADFSAAVAGLRQRGFPVDLVEGPSSARRVATVDDVRALEAVSRP